MSNPEAPGESKNDFYTTMFVQIEEMKSNLRKIEEKLFEISDDLFSMFLKNMERSNPKLLETAIDASSQFEIVRKICSEHHKVVSENK
uniref:Outer kinetochore protein DAD4 n=1 Tax=Schistosoma mansoni TaxID=6183 RepID=A0A5K4FAI8_SCHMA